MQLPDQPVGEEVLGTDALYPGHSVLYGRLVNVVPLDAQAHAATLFPGIHGAEGDRVWTYLAAGPYADLASFEESLASRMKSTNEVFYTILDRASGDAIGMAALINIHRTNRSVEIGNIVYTARLQRSPSATEAMYLLARYVFEELGYRRYEWKCNALNTPSWNAALRYGFRFEGVFRQHMIVKGRSRDTAWFSMLDREWPERKAALERWLDPTNFNPDGQQRSALQRPPEAEDSQVV